MPQYHLPRFFVPDDKDIADMLDACGTAQDKMWEIAAGFGIFCSKEDQWKRMQEYVARLPMDHNKLLTLYELNSSRDRDDKVSKRTLTADVALEKAKAIVNEVRDARVGDSAKEKYQIKQTTATEFVVTVDYQEPDYSKASAIQVRDKEIKIIVEKTDGKIAIRHNSNERASSIVGDIEAKIAAALGVSPPRTLLDFSGIRDAKKRSQFFTELISKIPNSTLRDVPNLKVYRLKPEVKNSTEVEDEAEIKAAEGEVRRVMLTGANLMLSEEYQQLEKRGFFIGSIVWVTEMAESDKPRFELTAEFNSSDKPTNLSYSVSGKYDLIEGKGYRTYKVRPSEIERNVMIRALEEAAGEIYETLITPPPDGPTNPIPVK